MADWVIYDTGAAAATLPPSLATAYAAWLDAATRAQRLALLVSGVVADFRKAVAADADPVGGENAASVPVSCLRQVSAVVWYTLALEMGEGASVYRSAWLDSEIYLRRLYQDLESGGAASGATGTPRYAPGSLPASGDGIAATGALLHVPAYSPISYAPPPG
jgi:hypothetical protein